MVGCIVLCAWDASDTSLVRMPSGCFGMQCQKCLCFVPALCIQDGYFKNGQPSFDVNASMSMHLCFDVSVMGVLFCCCCCVLRVPRMLRVLLVCGCVGSDALDASDGSGVVGLGLCWF